ncbi:MAG: hypothetical protein OXT67_00755 [Zetaproteobacteria bacterium]|nr:hypothetical protein [Zetaproteobacteria bacterium]
MIKPYFLPKLLSLCALCSFPLQANPEPGTQDLPPEVLEYMVGSAARHHPQTAANFNDLKQGIQTHLFSLLEDPKVLKDLTPILLARKPEYKSQINQLLEQSSPSDVLRDILDIHRERWLRRVTAGSMQGTEPDHLLEISAVEDLLLSQLLKEKEALLTTPTEWKKHALATLFAAYAPKYMVVFTALLTSAATVITTTTDATIDTAISKAYYSARDRVYDDTTDRAHDAAREALQSVGAAVTLATDVTTVAALTAAPNAIREAALSAGADAAMTMSIVTAKQMAIKTVSETTTKATIEAIMSAAWDTDTSADWANALLAGKPTAEGTATSPAPEAPNPQAIARMAYRNAETQAWINFLFLDRELQIFRKVYDAVYAQLGEDFPEGVFRSKEAFQQHTDQYLLQLVQGFPHPQASLTRTQELLLPLANQLGRIGQQISAAEANQQESETATQ